MLTFLISIAAADGPNTVGGVRKSAARVITMIGGIFIQNTGPALKHLTHCGLVTPYGDIDLGLHWLR